MNKVEYLIRGLGYVKNVADIENTVVTVREGVPVRISDIAFVNIGPGTRRGGLDKEGVEAVGGVVIARYGSNPLEVINNVKEKIHEMDAGMPQKTLADGTVSKVTVVPFYGIDKGDHRYIGDEPFARDIDLYYCHHCVGT